MALVNQTKREINAKIVFFGPELAGKATNLKHVFGKLKPEFRGTMKSMSVQDARMLFFDFTPPGDGHLQGFRVRIHVYTISGQVADPALWKMVLKGTDGVVFVADAAPHRATANRESLDDLTTYLQGYGQNLASIPVVFQFNKRDLSDALEAAEMERMLNPGRLPSFQASSRSGEGVLPTLLSLVKTVLAGLRSRGLEGIATGEALQGVMESPSASYAPAFDQAVMTAGLESPSQPQDVSAEQFLEERALDLQMLEARLLEAQELESQELESPKVEAAQEGELSVELSGTPQVSGPGHFHLPLTIRSGARSKTVLLSLTIALEAE